MLDCIACRLISIHAPHTRSDAVARTRERFQKVFQSTPLIRGATTVCLFLSTYLRFQSTPLIRGATFNPRPSYEERRRRSDRPSSRTDFNPRPSYEERQAKSRDRAYKRTHFNPRPSYEERPEPFFVSVKEYSISIHAPHTRSDKDFQTGGMIPAIFQSTPLIRGATWCATVKCYACLNFNPRPSYEERRFRSHGCARSQNFNPRPSYEERPRAARNRLMRAYFNPRPSYEERHSRSGRNTTI